MREKIQNDFKSQNFHSTFLLCSQRQFLAGVYFDDSRVCRIAPDINKLVCFRMILWEQKIPNCRSIKILSFALCNVSLSVSSNGPILSSQNSDFSNLWLNVSPNLSQRNNQDGCSGQFKMYSNIRWYMLFIAELYSCWPDQPEQSPPIFCSTKVAVGDTLLRWQCLTQTCAMGLTDDSSCWLNPNWQFLVHSIYRAAQF